MNDFYQIAFQIFTSISLLLIVIAIIYSCLDEGDWFNRATNLIIFFGGFFVLITLTSEQLQHTDLQFINGSYIFVLIKGALGGGIFTLLYIISLVRFNYRYIIKPISIVLMSTFTFYLSSVFISFDKIDVETLSYNNAKAYVLYFIVTVFVGFSIFSRIIMKSVIIHIDYFKKKSKKNNSNYRFYSIYDPEKTDKEFVLKLLEDTIVLIENESNLKIEVRNDLTKRTKSIIKNVKSKKSNWHEILGSIKELIIILGALGSLAGGVIALDQAKTNLETAENIITITCVDSDIFVKNEINLITQKPSEVNKIEYEIEESP